VELYHKRVLVAKISVLGTVLAFKIVETKRVKNVYKSVRLTNQIFCAPAANDVFVILIGGAMIVVNLSNVMGVITNTVNVQMANVYVIPVTKVHHVIKEFPVQRVQVVLSVVVTLVECAITVNVRVNLVGKVMHAPRKHRVLIIVQTMVCVSEVNVNVLMDGLMNHVLHLNRVNHAVQRKKMLKMSAVDTVSVSTVSACAIHLTRVTNAN